MAALIVGALTVYAAAGVFNACAFLTVGIGRVSPAARGSYVFRALLIPGCILLWPYVLIRWLVLETLREGSPLPSHQPPLRVQQGFALLLILAVPAALATAVLIRQQPPMNAEPVQVAPPAGAGASAAP
ncbi:MAG: hypothetical protein AAGF45_01885 [Pseudomonadota bacterium]